MALTDQSIFEADATGTLEIISLDSQRAVVASAFYATDPSGKPMKATVTADRKSLSFTVIAGIQALTVTLMGTLNETATLRQGANPLLDIHVTDGTGVGALLIQGK